MGQKFLQITESVAFSQGEKDWRFEDAGIFTEWSRLHQQFRERQKGILNIIIF
jgi:hypothetical protein